MKVSSTIETITPQMAESWLEKNKENRPVRDDHVAMLGREMFEGRWELNGEAIVFDYDGNLLDGQHRLWAAYEKRVSFTSVVVRGVAPEVFSTIDSGMKRSAGDVLGKAGLAYGTLTAAALRLVNFYETGASNNRLIQRCSNAETLELAKKHPGIERAASLVGARHTVKQIVPGSAMAAFVYFALQADEEKTLLFIESMVTGADLRRGDPRLACRNLFINFRQNRTRVMARAQFALLIKAWNAYVTGKEMSVLKFLDSEEFPRFAHHQMPKKILARRVA